METIRSDLIFTFTTYIVFGVVPSLHVSIWFFGKSATLYCRFPGWGLGGPFIFVKGVGWTCKSRLVKSWCTVRACLQCRVKARFGSEGALFILLVRLFLFLATIIKAGTVGAFCESSSVASFGCVPGNTFELVKT